MSEVSKFITVLKGKRVESLKNARQKNNLPLFTGEAIAYRESIDLAKEMLLPVQPILNEKQQIVIELEMSDCSVEVTGWNYPEELDTENLRYLFSNVLENARATEQEEDND